MLLRNVFVKKTTRTSEEGRVGMQWVQRLVCAPLPDRSDDSAGAAERGVAWAVCAGVDNASAIALNRAAGHLQSLDGDGDHGPAFIILHLFGGVMAVSCRLVTSEDDRVFICSFFTDLFDEEAEGSGGEDRLGV
jgi:hypothetical protein